MFNVHNVHVCFLSPDGIPVRALREFQKSTQDITFNNEWR